MSRRATRSADRSARDPGAHGWIRGPARDDVAGRPGDGVIDRRRAPGTAERQLVRSREVAAAAGAVVLRLREVRLIERVVRDEVGVEVVIHPEAARRQE